jgi:hypothetical protein
MTALQLNNKHVALFEYGTMLAAKECGMLTMYRLSLLAVIYQKFSAILQQETTTSHGRKVKVCSIA